MKLPGKPLVVSSLEKAYELKSKKVPMIYKKWEKSRPKHCYDNCWHFLQKDVGAVYVLGFLLLDNSIPIEHAWLKKGKKYYDITISDDKQFTQTYYSFIELDFTAVNKLAGLCEYVPDIIAYTRFRDKL